MDALDPRHGTVAGAIAHQRNGGDYCDRCAEAKARYDKRRKWEAFNGRPLTVASLGARRRMQALQALGWSRPQIASAAGWETTGALNYLLRSDTITRSTHDRMVAAYERLAMVIPAADGGGAVRARTWARRRGYAPPLAWDNIDDPTETPTLGGRDSELDPVIVMRLLEGRRVKANRAEREEAIRRWVEDGGSKTELCNIHGWEPGRYMVETRLRLVQGGAA